MKFRVKEAISGVESLRRQKTENHRPKPQMKLEFLFRNEKSEIY